MSNFSCEPKMAEQLQQFIDLLCQWNKAYNLTAIDDPEEIKVKHIVDSLSVQDYLHGEQIIDVGTGAGLPGIPLAIVCPDKQFTLLDSNGKKVRFIRQVVQVLDLKNVQAVHQRAEDFQPKQGFETVITRAFASIYDMLTATKHLLCTDGRFLAMKGILPEQELNELPTEFCVESIHKLDVPGLPAKRCLITIGYNGNTKR